VKKKATEKQQLAFFDGGEKAAIIKSATLTPEAERLLANFEALADRPESIEELRGLILNLAGRGRLTRQDSGEGSAEDLQTLLRSERERLIACGQFKGHVEAPDGALLTVPAGWIVAPMAALLAESLMNGRSVPDFQGGFPVLRLSAIRGNTVDFTESKAGAWTAAEAAQYVVKPGDFLIARGNGAIRLVGRGCTAGVSPSPVAFPDTMIRARMNPLIANIDWLRHIWASAVVRQQIETFARTTAGIFKVNQDHIHDVRLPLPPLAEQARIVAKVDELMALCDEMEARQAKQRVAAGRLNKAALGELTSAEGPEEFAASLQRVVGNFEALADKPESVAELRKALVDLASRGHLIKPDMRDQPVSIMLKQREVERRAIWEEREREKLVRQGKSLRGDKWKEAYEPAVAVLPEMLPDLPSTWAYMPIGLLGTDPFEPVQTGPFGAQLQASEFVSDGTPVIAVGNLTWNGFTRTGIYHITAEKAASLSRYDVQAGDLLFARSGATLGKVCVAPEYVRDWRMTGHILRVRLDARVITPALSALWLWASSSVKAQVLGTIRGGTRPGYNTSLLEEIVIPVPPMGQQMRILKELKHLMALCDTLEARIRAADEGARRLAESLVAELIA
jgi:type I restriction enzyme S subunit